jgi:hypothetical protein
MWRNELPEKQMQISNANMLEQQLQSKLHDAWISRRGHIPETARDRVVKISRWIVELGMVENIERFCAELKLSALSQLCIFQQRHIKVVDSRSDKEPAHNVPNLPKWLCHEVIRVEIGLPSLIARIAIYEQRAAIVRVARFVDRVSEGSTKREIIVWFTYLNWLPLGEYCNARNCPPCG